MRFTRPVIVFPPWSPLNISHIADPDTGAGTDAFNMAFVDPDTGAGVDASSLGDLVTSTDSNNPVQYENDDAYGNEVSVLTAVLPDTDTGAGADTGTVAFPVTTSSDTGAGSDATSQTASLSSSDTGAGADTGTVAAAFTDTDTGAGADTERLYLAATDTGTGADASSQTVTPTSIDTGTGVDVEAVHNAVPVDTDTGVAIDVQHATALYVSGDTGANTGITTVGWGSAAWGSSPWGGSVAVNVEQEALHATNTSTETGTDAEVELLGKGDAGVGVDTEDLKAQVFDTAVGVDTQVGPGGVQVSDVDADFAAATETGALTTRPVDTDQFTGVDNGALTFPTSGHGLDTETLAVHTTSVELVVNTINEITEATTLVTATSSTPSDTDTAVGADTFAINYQVADTGTSSETQTIPTALSFVVQDSGGSISRPQSDVSDTDTGQGKEGYPGLIGPLWTFWGYVDWGAQLTISTAVGVGSSEAAVGLDLNLGLIARTTDTETGTAVDTATVVASTKTLVNDTDAGTGVDPEVVVNSGFVGITDTGVGADTADRLFIDPEQNNTVVEATAIAIVDTEFGLGIDTENLPFTSSDTGAGVDAQTFVIKSADTGTGADTNLVVTYKDQDTGTSTEVEGLKQPDVDTGHGVEQFTVAQIANQVTVIDVIQEGTGAEHENVAFSTGDTGTGTEKVGSSNDQGFATEVVILRVVGLSSADTGAGHTFATVGLPTAPDLVGILNLIPDVPGVLTLTGISHGTLTLTTDTAGTLTLAADTPGTLVLTPLGDTRSD